MTNTDTPSADTPNTDTPNADTAEGEGTAPVAGEDVTQIEGFTAIADLVPSTLVNVLAVCTCEPWCVSRNLWKARLTDASGQINVTSRGTKFKFKLKDVVAGYAFRVKDYRGASQLVACPNSKITVNPKPDEEVTKLQEWYQDKASQLMNERHKEGFTPLADLTVKSTVNVLAVCTRSPWSVGKMMWKTLLRDESGQVVAMKRDTAFGFEFKDVVAMYSLHVSQFKRTPELEVRRYSSEILVNPDLPEASKLRDWYQNQVSQVEDKTISQITDLKKNTTANILAVCTSDPMLRPSYGFRRQIWHATLRDASGSINAMKDDTNFTFGLNDVIEARRVFVRDFMSSAEIVIDNNTVLTINPDTEEAKKLKEWYQSQGVRDGVKLTETETNQMGLKLAEEGQNQMQQCPNAQIKCDVCNVWCSGSAAYQSHVGGKPHQNAAAAAGLGLEGNNGTDEGPPAKKSRCSDDPNAITCDVCGIFVIGQVTYDAHIKGKAHSKKLRELETAKFISAHPYIVQVPGRKGVPADRREYKCTICQVHVTGMITIMNHISGVKHTKKAKALVNTAVFNAVQPPVTAEVQPAGQIAENEFAEDVQMKNE